MKRRLSKKDLARLEAGQLPEPTEDDVQAVIVDGLRSYGYLVQVTTRRVKKCGRCGAWPSRGDGATRGIADLLVRHPTWQRGAWLALEVKKPGPIIWSSPEQKHLAIVGDVIVVQSLEEALAAVSAASEEPKTGT